MTGGDPFCPQIETGQNTREVINNQNMWWADGRAKTSCFMEKFHQEM